MNSEELQNLRDKIGWKPYSQIDIQYLTDIMIKLIDHLILVEKNTEAKL